jgi:aldehyde:ferredoxin oxidoreductase
MELIRKIAYRDGFGNLLAEGCKRAADLVGKGSGEYCLHTKGLETSEWLKRAKGTALGVSVAARGGGHTTGAPNVLESALMPKEAKTPEMCEKIFGVHNAGDPTVYKGKAKVVYYLENLTAVTNCLGMCLFTSNRNSLDLISPEDYAGLYSAATGLKVTSRDLMRVGERIRNIEKVFNVLHADFGRKDDYPPKRFMNEPVKTGPYKGEVLDRVEYDGMLDEYYKLHNWNVKTGKPTQKSLHTLGLKEIAEDLKK